MSPDYEGNGSIGLMRMIPGDDRMKETCFVFVLACYERVSCRCSWYRMQFDNAPDAEWDAFPEASHDIPSPATVASVGGLWGGDSLRLIFIATLVTAVCGVLVWFWLRRSRSATRPSADRNLSNFASGLQRARERAAEQAAQDLQREREHTALALANRISEEKSRQDARSGDPFPKRGRRLGTEPTAAVREPFLPPDMSERMRYVPYTSSNLQPEVYTVVTPT
jgi:hypothetical protein